MPRTVYPFFAHRQPVSICKGSCDCQLVCYNKLFFFLCSPSPLSLLSPTLSSLSSPYPTASCYPPSVRITMARWRGLRLRPVSLPPKASLSRCAAVLRPSVGAVSAPTPHITILCMMSRWRSSVMCPFLVEKATLRIKQDKDPCPSLPATMTQQCHSSAGGGEWWITGMSSWLIRRTSCTIHHRPRGSSGSEYTYHCCFLLLSHS